MGEFLIYLEDHQVLSELAAGVEVVVEDQKDH